MEPIAIIGLGCRLPPAVESPDDFWRFLLSGANAVGDVPPGRWGDRYFHPNRGRPGRSYNNSGAFLTDITGFDAAFFGITPREAEWMDPQQRLLLEVAWHAFEDAGQPAERLAGSDTAVFIGAGTTDFLVQRSRHVDSVGPYTMTGVAVSVTANRLSHCFDLHGPSMAIDTACSSGMVALHEAVQALQRGHSRMALVGAVNLLLEPFSMVGFAKAGMLSPTGQCHSFDARADGYVRGEGAVALVLKPLSAAKADGDRIHALILGSAVNSDGYTQGITLPNQAAQEDVLRQAYIRAGISFNEIDYVEAHGTGTPVGDPIECRSLGTVLGAARSASPLAIGSVKTQTGHLEVAAGLVGLLKAVLILKHRIIPATLDFVHPNPAIPFAELNLRVTDQPTQLAAEWKAGVVGVNCFGFGGTNAHVVLGDGLGEDDPAARAVPAPDASDLTLLLSARSEASLTATARSWVDRLTAPSSASWTDLCWTAVHRRSHHPYRLAVHAANAGEAAKRLAAFLRNEPRNQIASAATPATTPARQAALVFSGNGSQWLGMGIDLYRDDLEARRTIDHIAEALRELGGADVIPVFNRTAAASYLAAADLAQPALFALQIAIVDWLKARGVFFSAVVGHSVGELAAAYAAGALSFDDAIRILHVRSRAQQRTAGRGKMLVAALSPEDAARRIAPLFGAVAIAAINAPESVTLSGESQALDAIAVTLEEEGKALRRLDLDYAFHSPIMDPIEAEVRSDLACILPRPTNVTFVSTVTGAAAAGETLDASYWWENIRRPVLFTEALATLRKAGFGLFVEIGPAPVLSGNIRECLRSAASTGAVIPTLRHDNPSIPALWQTLGQLYVQGAQLDFDRFPPTTGSLADLPTYPWDRRYHWAETDSPEHPEPAHPLLGDRLPTAQPTWHGAVDTDLFPFLADHRVQGIALLPATAFVELCVAAARQMSPSDPIAIDALALKSGLPVDGATALVETAYAPDDGLLTIRSKPKGSDAGWTLNAQAHLRRMGHASPPVDLAAARKRCTDPLDAENFYLRCAQHGFAYGPQFRTIDAVWIGHNEALCRLIPDSTKTTPSPDWHLPPALTDACLQLAIVLSRQDEEADFALTLLPVGVQHIRAIPNRKMPAFCHVVRRGAASKARHLDGTIMDAAGSVLCELQGIELQAISRPSTTQTATEIYCQRFHLLDPPLLPNAIDRDQPLTPTELMQHCAGTVMELAEGLDRLAISGDWLRRFDALCEAWLARLHSGDDDKGTPSLVPTLDPRDLWGNLLADAPDRLSELFLAAQLGEQLPRLAAGTVTFDELLAGSTARGMLEALYDLAPVSRCWAAALAGLLLKAAAAARPSDNAFRILLLGDVPPSLVTALQTGPAAGSAPWSVTVRSRLSSEDYSGPKCDAVLVINPMEEDWGRSISAALRADGLLFAWQRRFGALERLARGKLPATDGQISNLKSEVDNITPTTLESRGFSHVEIIADQSGLDSGRLFIARQAGAAALTTPSVSPSLWLLVIDDSVGATVAELLSRQGQLVITAGLGNSFRRHGDRNYEVATDPEDFHLLCQALADDGLEAEQVVFLCGLKQADPTALPRVRDLAALYLIQALDAVSWLAAPRLTLVTGGAFAPGARVPLPAQAPLWGLGRVAMSEASGLRTRLIDFSLTDRAPIESLVTELLWPCPEEEVVLAGSERYALRIDTERQESASHPAAPAKVRDDVVHRLVIGRQGALDSLHFEASGVLPPLAPTAVAIRVVAAGLNFRDVAWALRLLPDEAVMNGLFGPSFGLECAGVVTGVGDAVRTLRPGDRVVAMGPGCLATHVVQDAAWVHRLPDRLTVQQAATLPVALTTALYALDDAARLRPDETVLIHAAAGGVGLAAVRLAFARGARVLATAGSSEKRDFLARLGVEAVFDSRGTGFVDDVLAYTGGEGVDVVLNSLSGEALEAGLSLLKPFGRFVEIGKRDLYGDRRIGLRPLRHHGSLHAVDMDRLMRDRPEDAHRISRQLGDVLAAGDTRGLPFREYPFARAEDAFRAMQQGAHIGKIILSADCPLPASRRPLPRVKLHLDSTGSILVTGGFAGFGLATAHWLVAKGAKRLILVGRSGPTPESAMLCAALRETGAIIDEELADVGDYDAMAAVFARAAGRNAPISGVIHAAAVYDDAVLAKQDCGSFDRVMRPKALGAWNLHRLTADLRLDFFVLYGSASSAIGNGGQANYVAANLYLESLAAWRNAQGLPALALAFGPIGDVGYLARTETVRNELSARWGTAPLTASTALDCLEPLLGNAEGMRIIMPAGWPTELGTTSSRERTRFRGLVRAVKGDGRSALSTPLADWPRLTAPERQSTVEAFLVKEIGKVLRLELKQIQADEPLGTYGLDSLMAVELALSIETGLGIDLRALELTSGSLRSVSARLIERLDRKFMQALEPNVAPSASVEACRG
ncbi:MAG: type I polyketide synthase [Methylovirgula sp.]